MFVYHKHVVTNYSEDLFIFFIFFDGLVGIHPAASFFYNYIVTLFSPLPRLNLWLRNSRPTAQNPVGLCHYVGGGCKKEF